MRGPQSPNDGTNLMKIELGNKELKRGELVTVADGDGQQYVVLEVIQLEDGTEQQVAVVAPEFIDPEDEGGMYSTWSYKTNVFRTLFQY